jgi:hypothetical protein
MERDMWARRLLGALVTGAAAVYTLVACGVTDSVLDDTVPGRLGSRMFILT